MTAFHVFGFGKEEKGCLRVFSFFSALKVRKWHNALWVYAKTQQASTLKQKSACKTAGFQELASPSSGLEGAGRTSLHAELRVVAKGEGRGSCIFMQD